VNAVYPSRLPIGEKITHCEQVYGAAKLPVIFRITPFSEPPGLEAALAERGYARFEETAVETAAMAAPGAPPQAQPMSLEAWADAIGEMRGSTAGQRAGHLARLRAMPLEFRAVAIESGERVAATGLVVLERDWAGLFDIITAEEARGRGFAREVVRSLLAIAWELGARNAYLQVGAENAVARRLYRQFGFAERYTYWYRGREGERH
jgi:ribosomal protein S18 acetylase RimI-like enzyme